MKQINFIKTLSPYEQQAIHYWYTWSLLAILMSLVCMGLIYIKQIYTIKMLEQEKNRLIAVEQEYTNALARKKTDTDLKTIYAQKAHKIKNHLYNPKNPHDLIQAILTIHTKNSVALQSIHIQKHILSLRGSCTQPDHALNLIHDLNKLPTLDNVALISLEKKALDSPTQPSLLTCTIVSDIKK